MESVVKAIGKPVSFSDATLDEDDNDLNINESNADIQPRLPNESGRKRRHSNSDRFEMANDKIVNYQVGSRYWGGEEEKRNAPKRDAKYKEDESYSYKKDAKSEENKHNQREHQPTTTKEKDPILMRTGGAYIPPAKLRLMQAQITDKTSLAFQRLAWEALKKSIHGLINKVNVSNIPLITTSLMKENIVRGRGLLSRSIVQAQAASPTFTHVYAALVALINSKFPNIGELMLTRLVLQFRRAFRRNDKPICLTSTRFIAHLVNQQVAHEVLALEILTLLLENATDDSVEVAVGFLKECGQKLGEVSPRGLTAVFDRLRHVLHEADLDKRVKYMIEVMFQVRKDGFKDNPSVITELDLVEEEDQFTHLVSIQEELDPQEMLNVFKQDPDYEINEEKYQAVKAEIIGSGSDSDGESDGSDESNEESSSDEEAKEAIVDETETNLIALRRTIYLTIQSSLDHNECAHKMMKMQMKPGQEVELCHMILDCCAQQRTYEKFFGLLAQRFCQINKAYIPPFEQIFRDTYCTIHRLDTNKLRNVGKMFAHLLFTDAISWQVLAHIRLTEEDTTSSSRIFLKILFQELAEYMGLGKLNLRLKDPTLQAAFEGVFPRDDPRNTRFAINFFTSIGLGGLTDELRLFLRNHPKPPPVVMPAPTISTLSSAAAQLLDTTESSDSDSSDSDLSDSDLSDSDSSDSSSSSSSSNDERKKKKKKLKITKSKTKKGSKSDHKESKSSNRIDKESSKSRITTNDFKEISENSKRSERSQPARRSERSPVDESRHSRSVRRNDSPVRHNVGSHFARNENKSYSSRSGKEDSNRSKSSSRRDREK